jgi:hypothetical protein
MELEHERVAFEAYRRNPTGGWHWRVRVRGRVVEESQGAFYGPTGADDAVSSAKRLWAMSFQDASE